MTAAEPPLRCPLHDIPDCSPLLNGCHLPIRLADYPRELVDAAVAGIAATYTPKGQPLMWALWLSNEPTDRRAWLERAARRSEQTE